MTGNEYAFIHVSIIRMCNKTTAKACLFKQNLLCLDLLQKQWVKTIGNYCYSSLNISGIHKNVNIDKFLDDLYIYPIIERENYLNLHVLKFYSFVLDF